MIAGEEKNTKSLLEKNKKNNTLIIKCPDIQVCKLLLLTQTLNIVLIYRVACLAKIIIRIDYLFSSSSTNKAV